MIMRLLCLAFALTLPACLGDVMQLGASVLAGYTEYRQAMGAYDGSRKVFAVPKRKARVNGVLYADQVAAIRSQAPEQTPNRPE
jgi:hypothetical protein